MTVRYNGDSGLVITGGGRRNVDVYGLHTSSLALAIRRDQADSASAGLGKGSVHPRWSYLTLERVARDDQPGVTTCLCDFGGLPTGHWTLDGIGRQSRGRGSRSPRRGG